MQCRGGVSVNGALLRITGLFSRALLAGITLQSSKKSERGQCREDVHGVTEREVLSPEEAALGKVWVRARKVFDAKEKRDEDGRLQSS